MKETKLTTVKILSELYNNFKDNIHTTCVVSGSHL